MANWLNASKNEDRQTVSREAYDVVMVGSSFATMFFLAALPPDLRVLILEKGSIIAHEDQRAIKEQVTETFQENNTSGIEKDWVARTLFGGNSNCWGGQVPRFHPNDFRLKELYGVGAPWPVGYEDLEQFYVEAEEIMEVAGGHSDHLLPRSAPFPFPPHRLSRSDEVCRQHFPDIWVPCATARSNGGSRPVCCANGVCENCPIEAKFTIANTFAKFDRPSLTIMTGAEVRAVNFMSGRARGLVAWSDDGAEFEIEGDIIGLGANAIFNAGILMRSGVENPALGHYLHEEAGLAMQLDIGVPGFFGGSWVSGFCYGAYDGPHRSEVAAVLIESHNKLLSPRMEQGRWTDRMSVVLVADDLPMYQNAVSLDSEGEVHIEWQGHSDYAVKGIERAEAMLPDLVPFEIERVVSRSWTPTLYHIQGTHRMGDDPGESVTDRTLRLHGQDNLFVLGSGAFPTCSPANPTLTLAALSLHAGRSI